jgi:hypothetical protein
MRQRIAAVTLSLVLFTLCTGCKLPKITFSVTVTPQGQATAANQKTFTELSPSDAINNSSTAVNALVDADPTLSYDSTAPAQAVVTVTTDTGQTYAQAFNMVPADASSFSPASSGTVTHAFTAQNPTDVSSFIQAAASHASASLTVDVQTRTTFQGPTDGNAHTVIGRQYTSTDGVTTLGSSTYFAPAPSNCGGDPGDFSSTKQLCSN